MSCYYIIKAPGGGEDIKIPVNFGLLNEDPAITSKLEALKEASNDVVTSGQQDKQNDLINDISAELDKLTPAEISSEQIKNTIVRNIDSLENVIPELNKSIAQLGNQNNINAAIIQYIKSKSGNLKDLMAKLSKPITPTYFKGLSLDGVLGVTNLKQEYNKISGRIQENTEFGFSNVIPKNLKTFVNAVINGSDGRYKQLYEANVLLGTNNTYGARALNMEDYTFFNINDDLSLFSGLFKRIGSDLDKKELYDLVNAFNNDPKVKKFGKVYNGTAEDFDPAKFFNGELGDNGRLKAGGFDRLIDWSKNEAVRDYAFEIFKLIGNHINPNDFNLIKSMQTLFVSMNPDKYGDSALKESLQQEQSINNEIKTGQAYKNKMLSEFLSKVSGNRDSYYGDKKEISSNLFQEATDNIAINQDIVKLKSGNIAPFAVVTAIYPRPDGVLIYGTYKNQFDEYESVNQLFKSPSDVISYRKRETPIDAYVQGEDVQPKEGIVLTTKTTFSSDVLKKILRKGDKIITRSGDKIIVGVNPGNILVKNTKGDVSEIKYSSVKAVSSAQAKLDIYLAQKADIKKYVQISDPTLLSDGDLFKDPGTEFYKQILYSDENNVYSWIEQANKEHVIRATPRNTIKAGLLYTYGKLTEYEIQKIDTELNNIGRSDASMSSFKSDNSAKNDDYFVIESNGKKVFGKVTNDKVKKGIIYNYDTRKLEPIIYADKDATFLTNRDISSNFWTSVSKINDWKIDAYTEEDADKIKSLKEAQYVIPKDVDPHDLIWLPSNYANIGKFRDMGASIGPDEKVATKEILRLMRENSTAVPTDAKLYLETEDADGFSKKYKRNLANLHRIGNFDKLGEDVKKELNMIQPGTYFSVYKDAGLDSNIYRIMSVNNGIVTAHLNKISKYGRVLTTEKQFKVEDLLATKLPTDTQNKTNSISALYLQEGNNKFGIVLKAINEKMNVSEVVNQKEINTTVNRMKEAFRKINVGVKSVSAAEGKFENGQKAKIETTNEDGKIRTNILLNNESGTSTDLVHETLHIYSTLLRYSNPEIYNKFINSVLGDESDDLDVTAREELFVKKISEGVSSDTDFITKDVETFVGALLTAIKTINPDFEIDLTQVINDPLTALNVPLRDVFNVNVDNSHPMFSLSMIATEPAMREWMSKQGITLKC